MMKVVKEDELDTKDREDTQTVLARSCDTERPPVHIGQLNLQDWKMTDNIAGWKQQDWTMADWNLVDWKMTDNIAGVDWLVV